MNLNAKEIIRIEEVRLALDDDEADLAGLAAAILDLPVGEIVSLVIVKKNIDSRQRQIVFVYSLDVTVRDVQLIKNWDPRHRVRRHEPFIYNPPQVSAPQQARVVIVGSGPCGLFAALLLARAGLKPLLIERGQDVDARVRTVDTFFKKSLLNPESNIQFGEGGAGTFSDGKLYTLINDPRSQYVFAELIKAGAPAEIAWSATPHIGTDKLRLVVKNLRQTIIALGGTVRFETCLSDLVVKQGRLRALVVNDGEEIPVDQVVLATGHSARDTYQMLWQRKVQMSAKPFAIGLRIEHRAELINRARFGAAYQHPKLGAAKYKLVQHLSGQRSVYTFCMCPGGYVVGAASEVGGVVVNGMSEYAQDGANSNSALLVPVLPTDFGTSHPLAGIEFQRRWERQAFAAGGANYQAPAQLVGDFLRQHPSRAAGSVAPTYRPGVKFTSLDACLPTYVIESLRRALPLLDKKLLGFADPAAVLTGVETRSSAPLRLERNEQCEANISGLYPAGEGAGHAGGIVSSAIDGLRVAEKIIARVVEGK